MFSKVTSFLIPIPFCVVILFAWVMLFICNTISFICYCLYSTSLSSKSLLVLIFLFWEVCKMLLWRTKLYPKRYSQKCPSLLTPSPPPTFHAPFFPPLSHQPPIVKQFLYFLVSLSHIPFSQRADSCVFFNYILFYMVIAHHINPCILPFSLNDLEVPSDLPPYIFSQLHGIQLWECSII